jgi:hypothetical protein
VQFYRISGLSVASEITLPGLITDIASPNPDVTVRRGAVPDRLERATGTGPTWQVAGARFLLHISGVARFMLEDGRSIVFAPDSEDSLDDVPIFIIGSALGVLLHQRGQIVLHASAVRVNDKAVLFCGAAGAGKSTLAAALAQRGYPLVNDDVCSVSIEAGLGPRVHSDGRQLKLWAQAIDRLGLAPARGERVRAKIEKFYVMPSEVFTEPLPLGAAYMLREARPPHAPGIDKPNVVDAALLLRRNAYRPRLIRQFNQRASYFRAAADIANAAGIFHLTRALDFTKMPGVIAWLERHWHDLRLCEKSP